MIPHNLYRVLIISFIIASTLQTGKAQMIDMMGNIGVSGAITQENARQVGSMNKALRINQFKSQFSMKIAEILTTYLGDYRQMPTSVMNINGISVTFKPTSSGNSFGAHMNNIDSSSCYQIVSQYWDGLSSIKINQKEYKPQLIKKKGKSICQSKNNISLIFQ